MATDKLTLTISAGEVLPNSADPATPRRASAFDLVASMPWAITPEMLGVISDIARRDNEPIEALEAKLGRPLQNTRTVSVRNGVAIVPVTGPVFRYANLFTRISGATSLDVLAQDFNAALDDPLVSSIVLNIDSPGGQANGIAEFAAMVRNSSKPVTAYVDGSAASAAYWIAAAAGDVVMSKTALVGSIGAVITVDPKSREGQLEIVSSQSPNKRPDLTTDAGRAQIQRMIDALAQVFIEDVAAYRGVSVETVLSDFGQGDVFIGAAAVERGMADRIGTLEEVIAELSGGKVKTASPILTKGVEAMNLEELRAAHPDLCAALVEEGRNAGFDAGAAAERQRIQDVEAQALPGHEALIATLKFDGKTSGPEAAVQVLAAERQTADKNLAAIRDERQKPLPAAAAPEDAPAAEDSMPLEDRAKAKWEKDATVRAEFGKFETFMAWFKADSEGRVKTHGKKG